MRGALWRRRYAMRHYDMIYARARGYAIMPIALAARYARLLMPAARRACSIIFLLLI